LAVDSQVLDDRWMVVDNRGGLVIQVLGDLEYNQVMSSADNPDDQAVQPVGNHGGLGAQAVDS